MNSIQVGDLVLYNPPGNNGISIIYIVIGRSKDFVFCTCRRVAPQNGNYVPAKYNLYYRDQELVKLS